MQLRGTAPIPDYFGFQLQLNYSGMLATTDVISAQAVALQADEVSGSTVRGHGESWVLVTAVRECGYVC